MKPISHISVARRWALASALAVSLFALPAIASGSGSRPGSEGLNPAAAQAAVQSEGDVVRGTDGFVVEDVTREVAGRVASVSAPVWKVEFSDEYPPRADRYEVLANGRLLGYGIPAPDERGLLFATQDPAVLSARLTTRYGTGDPAAASTGTVPSTQSEDRSTAGPQHKRATGPLTVTKTVYDLGDEVFKPSGFANKVELTANVHYPTGLPGGPYPLVIFMHGNHSACYSGGSTDYEWPCPPGFAPLPNYEGYDYIASELASYGYIVASISANGVNVLGNFVDDTGMTQRGEVIVEHIGLWKTWNTTGAAPFGMTFQGEVDMSSIGVMGHSRGGEGAVYAPIVDAGLATPYGIDAVLALAPVDFTRALIPNIPFSVMLPYCDGDVSDLQGVHFFDDSRYVDPGDPAMKNTVTAFGANHNFFNTVWTPGGGYPGAFDDGVWSDCSSGSRLTAAQEKAVGMAYISGFFRRYLGDDLSLDSMWTGETIPASIAPARTLVSYLAPDTPSTRLDVDRFTSAGDMNTDEQGGAVKTRNLTKEKFCPDTHGNPCVPGGLKWVDIHLTGLGQGVFGWNGPNGLVKFALPGGMNVSGFDVLQFRVAVNPGYKANNGVPLQDLAVRLVDNGGSSATVSASSVGSEPLEYPLTGGSGHMILNQLRFPLGDFAGVNLLQVKSVQIRFSETNKGVIDIADLAFSRGAV